MAPNELTDELFDRYARDAAKVAFAKGLDVGQQQGFYMGHAVGQYTGFVGAVNMLKPALSDGLRHGSSECGRAMQGLQNMIPDYVTDEELADAFEEALAQQ